MAPKRKNSLPHEPASASKYRCTAQPGSDPLPDRALALARQSLLSTITKGTTGVFRAIKKAKGFEKQKLSKRIKSARDKSEQDALRKLELELDAAKTIDMHALARSHVVKTLGKSRQIAGSDIWPKEIEPQGDVVMAGAEGDDERKARMNVCARIYGSNPVREAMAIVLENVRATMGLAASGKGPAVNKEVDGDVEMQDASGRESEDEKSRAEEIVSDDEDEEDEWDGIVEENQDQEVAGEGSRKSLAEEDEEADLDAFQTFEGRLAATDDEEELSERSGDSLPNQMRSNDEWSGSEDNWADTESSAEEGRSDSEDEASLRPSKKLSTSDKLKSATVLEIRQGPSKAAKSTPASTFLPTLMGGYVSGSDSDADAEYYGKKGAKKGPPEKKERKNRMGQQARRALWERQYGKEANHVLKGETVVKREKDSGRGRGRRVRGSSGRGRGAYSGIESRDEKPERPGRRTAQKEADDKPLHPSWEAARLAKQKKAAVKPTGKKITFD